MNETSLVQRFQAGDAAAFSELYELYKNPALRSAYLLTNNYFDSENVVQETFLKCYQNLPKLKEPASFKAWFYRILTRTAWEYCRRRDREPPAEIVAEGAEDDLAAAETRGELLAAIDRLPLKQKTVVVLYYYNEMTVPEIARATGALAGTVKSRLFAARRALRQMLAKDLETWR